MKKKPIFSLNPSYPADMLVGWMTDKQSTTREGAYVFGDGAGGFQEICCWMSQLRRFRMSKVKGLIMSNVQRTLI